MKTYTIQDIRDLDPCYDPVRFLPERWTGTVLDILDVVECPEADRIWVTVQLIDAKIAKLYAVWCVREVLALVDAPDQRSITVCDVVEQHVHGKVSDVKLATAVRAARSAAEAAEAARAAEAVGVAEAAEAARAAEATWVAARAAWAATGSAGAAWAAEAAVTAWVAAEVAGVAEAAEVAEAVEAARSAQINKLRQLIELGGC